MRKNKREIPAELKIAPNVWPVTKFCHRKDLSLLSYTPKKKSNKIVFIASSLLHTVEITDGKPNIVRHYNATKRVDDNYDKLCHSYTVRGRTNR